MTLPCRKLPFRLSYGVNTTISRFSPFDTITPCDMVLEIGRLSVCVSLSWCMQKSASKTYNLGCTCKLIPQDLTTDSKTVLWVIITSCAARWPPQYAPAPWPWLLTFWLWSQCGSRMWPGVPLFKVSSSQAFWFSS